MLSKTKLLRKFGLLATIALLATLLLSLSLPTSVEAGGTISAANCNEAGLSSAVAGGGMVTFTADCSITLTAPITISANTTIIGTGHNVVLSGGNTVGSFNALASGLNLTLQGLSIVNVKGSIIYTEPNTTLTVSNCTFSNNTAKPASFLPNALITNNGTMYLNSSTFSNSTGGSVILNNSEGFSGPTGSPAVLSVLDSTFTGNTNGTGAKGGVAITNNGSTATTVISNSTFSNNTGTGSGAVFTDERSSVNSRLIVNNSIFTGNKANSGAGGAINSDRGHVEISNSTFSANTAYVGGAIFAGGYTLGIKGSTFSNNIADTSVVGGNSSGGAIYTDGVDLTIANSTFSGNEGRTSGKGGAIYSVGSSNLNSKIINTTISGNIAPNGAGIYYDFNSRFVLENTIIANNSSTNCGGPGSISSSLNNLQWPGTSCGASVTSADPKLGPLQDNGGPTFTMALLLGSPAIDAGSNAICAATPIGNVDQRGAVRPGGTICDIGAYEAGVTPPPTYKVTTIADDAANPPAGSLRKLVVDAGLAGGANITFASSLGLNPEITLVAPLVIGTKIKILADCTNPVKIKASFANPIQLTGGAYLRGVQINSSVHPALKITGSGNHTECSKAR